MAYGYQGLLGRLAPDDQDDPKFLDEYGQSPQLAGLRKLIGDDALASPNSPPSAPDLPLPTRDDPALSPIVAPQQQSPNYLGKMNDYLGSMYQDQASLNENRAKAGKASQIAALLGGIMGAGPKYHGMFGTTQLGPTNEDVAQRNQSMQTAIMAPVQAQTQNLGDKERIATLLGKFNDANILNQMHVASTRKTNTENQVLQDENDPNSQAAQNLRPILRGSLASTRQDIINNGRLLSAPNAVGADGKSLGYSSAITPNIQAVDALSKLVDRLSPKQMKDLFGNVDKMGDNVARAAETISKNSMALAQLKSMADYHQGELNLGNIRALLEAEKAQRESDAASRKEAVDAKKYAIDGFPPKEGKETNLQDYKEMLASQKTFKSFMDSLNALESQVRESGVSPQKWAGKGGEMQQTYMKVLSSQRKSDNMGKFMVAEAPFFEQEFPSPSSLSAEGRELISPGDYLRRIQLVREHALEGMADIASSAGFDDRPFRKAWGMPLVNAYGQKITDDSPGPSVPGLGSAAALPAGGGGSHSGLPEDAKNDVRAVAAHLKKKIGISTNAKSNSQSANAAEIKAYANKYFGGDVDKAKQTLKSKGYNVQ